MNPSSPPPDNLNASIVQKICIFYKTFHKFLATFPKQEKFTLGEKVENTILIILETSLKASYLDKYNKKSAIQETSEKIDLLKYLVRLAYETRSINLKSYTLLEGQVIEIGRMCGGWLKSL